MRRILIPALSIDAAFDEANLVIQGETSPIELTQKLTQTIPNYTAALKDSIYQAAQNYKQEPILGRGHLNRFTKTLLEEANQLIHITQRLYKRSTTVDAYHAYSLAQLHQEQLASHIRRQEKLLLRAQNRAIDAISERYSMRAQLVEECINNNDDAQWN